MYNKFKYVYIGMAIEALIISIVLALHEREITWQSELCWAIIYFVVAFLISFFEKYIIVKR